MEKNVSSASKCSLPWWLLPGKKKNESLAWNWSLSRHRKGEKIKEGKSRERAAEGGYCQQAQLSARRFWKSKAGTLRISTQECSEDTWGMLRLRKTRLMNWVDSWVYVTCLSLSFSVCRLITRGVFQSRCENIRESLTYCGKAANC